jgi:DNA-directed RNA polymerase specialized sigma24 family protein
MAWDAVQFRDEYGNEIVGETRQTVLSFIEKGLRKPDADPETLINVALAVCAKIGGIRNLAAYLNKSVYTSVRKDSVAEKKRLKAHQELPQDDRLSSEMTSVPETIEQQVLLQQILDSLDGQDRQIYELHLKGYSFREIDERLRLKSRTSEYKYREAQSKLRRMLPPQR